MIDACGFTLFRDIQPERVERYLRDLREGPRKLSYGTSNRLQQHIEHFCNWAVERTNLHKSPLACLEKLKEEEYRRRVCRILSRDELRCLLAATHMGPERKGMSGYEQYLLYRFAAETGLRAGEIGRLRKADFAFDARVVMVKAANSQGRKACVIPLKRELSDRLKKFMQNKMPTAKAFGGRYKALTDRTAHIVKEDIEAVGLPYHDEAGLYFDFRWLRSQAGNHIISGGDNIKEAQEFM
jgi:integrase